MIGADYFKAHILPTINVIKGNYEYTKCKDLNIAICAGYLHDVVEDTPITYEELIKMGVWCEVVDVVEILTRDKGTSYNDYIRKILKSENEAAILVKWADLTVNVSTATANFVPYTLRKRYFNALGMLELYFAYNVAGTLKNELNYAIYARKELEELAHSMKQSNNNVSVINFRKLRDVTDIIPELYFLWKGAEKEPDLILFKVITKYKVFPEDVRHNSIDEAPNKIKNLFQELLKEYKNISVLYANALREYAKR